MKYVFIALGGLLALLVVGYFLRNGIFTGQVAFILIFGVILLAGWFGFKFIQKQ